MLDLLPREARVCSVHSHTLCRFYWGILWSFPCSSIDGFPDICITFPFCVAGKGSGMEKLLPRPVRPHGEGGEQSVRSPPATVGHICGQLSPLQQSEPLCILAYLCALLLSPRLFLLSLSVSHAQIQHLVTRGARKQTFCPHSSLFSFPDYLYWWGRWHMKRNHPLCRNAVEGWATSAERFTRRPQSTTSIHWLLLTQAYSQWNQGKGEHTHL